VFKLFRNPLGVDKELSNDDECRRALECPVMTDMDNCNHSGRECEVQGAKWVKVLAALYDGEGAKT